MLVIPLPREGTMMKTDGLTATEAECAAGRTAPRVSLADIEANIAAHHTFTAAEAIKGLDQPSGHPSLYVLTIALLVLQNGFTIIGKSAPASPANFDAELGAKLAYEDAVRQVWPLMGYELRERLHREAQPVDLDPTEQPDGSEPSDPLPPHIRRVVDERDQLTERRLKLIAFFDSPMFAGLDGAEQTDMREQAEVMADYGQVLNRRLERTGLPVD